MQFNQKVTVSGSDIKLGQVVLPYSWVTGTIVDRNGNPVVKAHYWLTDSQDKEYGSYYKGTVLSNGSFKTVAVADGEYVLIIEASGYTSLKKQVIVMGKDGTVTQQSRDDKTAH